MGPMAIFDPIFGSEDRTWGVLRSSRSKNDSIFGVQERRWGRFFEDGRSSKIEGGSSKIGKGVLRTWRGSSSKNSPIFEEPPHLRSSRFENRRIPLSSFARIYESAFALIGRMSVRIYGVSVRVDKTSSHFDEISPTLTKPILLSRKQPRRWNDRREAMSSITMHLFFCCLKIKFVLEMNSVGFHST